MMRWSAERKGAFILEPLAPHAVSSPRSCQTYRHTPKRQLLCVAAGALLQAIIEIISNPVNSTVPIASEILKAAGGCTRLM
jgi:hypothetical protein